MSKIADQTYLREQYQNASNLNDRIQLHVRFSTNSYSWQLWVFDQLKLAPRSRVLELGCGPGNLWRLNSARIPAGWEITLSDFSPGMLEETRRNLSGLGRPFKFEVADAQALPFDAASFDAVIANHMLYHVPERPKAFSEIRRALTPEGRFYAATNGEAHLQELHTLVSQFDPTIALWGKPGAHGFTLEGGGAQLAPWFANVTMHRQENALVVTEAEPLVAFVASMAGARLSGERRAAFIRFVEQQIESSGSIYITKESGLFEAYN
jgi:ubiquinone/menaquinone biosynthesis C-methylase UbiE